MTVLLIVLFLFGKMSLFDSVIHAFSTAGTGGFSSNNTSIAEYSSYVQWVITVFMFLFGVNFNLYFLIIIGKVREVIKSSEFWVYFGIVITSIAIVFLNMYEVYGDISESIKHSAFQVSSIITTTGFSSMGYNSLNALTKAVLFTLMFIGACAGSTAGGIKVSRIIILFKKVVNDVKKVIPPRTATVVKYEQQLFQLF